MDKRFRLYGGRVVRSNFSESHQPLVFLFARCEECDWIFECLSRGPEGRLGKQANSTRALPAEAAELETHETSLSEKCHCLIFFGFEYL